MGWWGNRPILELLRENSLRNSLCRRRAGAVHDTVTSQTHVLGPRPPAGCSPPRCVSPAMHLHTVCPSVHLSTPLLLPKDPLHVWQSLPPCGLTPLGSCPPSQALPSSSLVLPRDPGPTSFPILVISLAPAQPPQESSLGQNEVPTGASMCRGHTTSCPAGPPRQVGSHQALRTPT